MKLIFLMILLAGVISSVRGQANYNYDDYSDEQLYFRLSSTCADDTDLAATEFLKRGERIIPFLLSKKGDRNLFFGKFYRTSETNPGTHILAPTNDMEYNKARMKE